MTRIEELWRNFAETALKRTAFFVAFSSGH